MPSTDAVEVLRPGFRSYKTDTPIRYSQRWHRDVLIQLTLDPAIESICAGPPTQLPHALSLYVSSGSGRISLTAVRDDGMLACQRTDAGTVFITRSRILRDPRASTARAVWSVRKHIVPAAARLRTLDFLLAEGRGASISRTTSQLQTETAYEVVLAMVCDGSLVLDIDRPLTPDTVVELPVERWRGR